jgi:hypothetical protein
MTRFLDAAWTEDVYPLTLKLPIPAAAVFKKALRDMVERIERIGDLQLPR